MSERKDEQWLDNQLQRAVDGSTPVFDAESWKRRHPGEYEALLARRGSSEHRIRPAWGLRVAGLAIAAVVVMAVGLLLFHWSASRPEKPTAPIELMANSAAEMMTMRSLRMAYEQGGFDGLDRQLQSTLDEFGPRSSSVSLQELF